MFTQVLSMNCDDYATGLRFTDITGIDTGDGTKWDGIAGLDSSTIDLSYLRITHPDGTVQLVNNSTYFNALSNPFLNDSFVYPLVDGTWVDGYYTVIYDLFITGSTPNVSITDYGAFVADTVLCTTLAAHSLVTGMYVQITSSTDDQYNGFYEVTVLSATQFYITVDYVGNDTVTLEKLYRQSFTFFNWANVEIALDKMYVIFAEMGEGAEADLYLKDIEMGRGLLNAIKGAYEISNETTVNALYNRITRMLSYHSIDLTYI